MRPAVRNFIAVFVVSVVALALYGMVRDGHSASESQGIDCSQVTVAAGTFQHQAADADGSATVKRTLVLNMAHVIANNPGCFAPEAVAAAQTAIGH